jgi:hypothetical protein
MLYTIFQIVAFVAIVYVILCAVFAPIYAEEGVKLGIVELP